ncbi:MAG: S41 family peptidase [Ruminococcus sp.]|nr:S41 family peptidase [Ruminococcus sp.]
MKKKSQKNAETPKHTVVQIQKSTLVFLIAICFILAIGMALGFARSFHLEEKYSRLDQLVSAVDAAYYTDVDEEAAMDGALKGYVDGLDDPYSQYMTSAEYTSYQTTESGTTTGIGITMSVTEDGYMHIESVLADTPAAQAGLQADDVVVAVDGQDVAEIGYEAAVSLIRDGDEDTSVCLTILRDEETFDQEASRMVIEVASCWGQMLENNVGYIRIASFKENTPEQFQEIFDQLLEDGVQSFVFDLRDDGGGLVTSLEQILDPLLPEGEIAVATYKDGTTKTLVTSDAEKCDLPMVVIVNENTASAAELFTVSLSDFGKATVVGVTTYGKGVMQVTQELPDGGALTITTATYRTTKGECYHGVGITPDEEVEIGDYEVNYENPDSENDLQLARALEILITE